MQRINVSLDDETYNTLRAMSFQTKKTMAEIVRSSLSKTLSNSTKKKEKLILDAYDEKELLAIIDKNEYITEAEFEKELGL